MDWKDPKTTELVLQYTLILSALGAVVMGYLTSSFKVMFLVYCGCVSATLLVIVPDWPYFCRHPREWMTPKRAAAADEQQRDSSNVNNIDNAKHD